MGRAALPLLALILGACISYGDHAHRVRQELIGMPANSLRYCIGDPASVDVDGEVEYVTYRWALGATRSGRQGAEVYAPQPSGVGSSASRAPDAFETGYCEIVFEVRERAIADLKVEGRTAAGLNDDARCMLFADRCTERRR